jgi:hypothetical protein
MILAYSFICICCAEFHIFDKIITKFFVIIGKYHKFIYTAVAVDMLLNVFQS